MAFDFCKVFAFVSAFNVILLGAENALEKFR